MAGETSVAQAFFNPTSPFGSLTNWEPQTENPSNSRQRAQALGSDGDEIAAQTFDLRNSVTATYVAKSSSAAIPKGGAVLNGYHVDTIQVQYVNNDFVRMTLNGHKHSGSNHNTCRTYTGSLATVGVLFGCPASPLGLVIPTGAGVRSFTYTLEVNHVDEAGSQGNQLKGDNYDGKETVEVDLCDSGSISADTGWTLMTDGHNRGNTIAEASTATAEHHLAHDGSNS